MHASTAQLIGSNHGCGRSTSRPGHNANLTRLTPAAWDPRLTNASCNEMFITIVFAFVWSFRAFVFEVLVRIRLM